MIRTYANIFEEKHCSYVANGMLKAYENSKTVKDNTDYSNGALGFYDLPEAFHLAVYVEKVIKRDYGDKFKFANNYTRIYKNGNCLKIHTDRRGLDLTISICVFSNLKQEWPLHISGHQINVPWHDGLPIEEFKKNSEPFYTPVGTGVACLGYKNPHWRDTLVCDEDEMVIQTFYHWSAV